MRVVLDNLRPDMVLAADIVDGTGRLLLPSGTVLTEKHLRYCQMWGIPDAEIAGDEPAEEPEEVLDPARIAEAEEAVKPRFAHVSRDHPAIEELFRYCVTAHLRKRP
jgi:hypothetical protein